MDCLYNKVLKLAHAACEHGLEQTTADSRSTFHMEFAKKKIFPEIYSKRKEFL